MLKRLVIFAVFATVFFGGCGVLGPGDGRFDLGDTVAVAIGQTLYESDSFWVRLDSISEDSRCPEGMMCVWAGRAVAWMTVGNNDTSFQYMFSTHWRDSSRTQRVCFEADPGPFPEAPVYNVTMTGVTPYPVAGEVIRPREYRVHFTVQRYDTFVKKPNIYLYPEEKTRMDVSLSFPHGGQVVKSIPSYPEEWQDIRVTPAGTIDKKYAYLFYEAMLPDHWQYSEGWVLRREHLPLFFTANMTQYGFNRQEIDDFLEYWMPQLKDAPYYAVYPQRNAMVNPIAKLHIRPRPDSILRLFYIIEAVRGDFELMEVEIPAFTRRGFTVTEWGVILRP
jgi:hypothetical protein